MCFATGDGGTLKLIDLWKEIMKISCIEPHSKLQYSLNIYIYIYHFILIIHMYCNDSDLWIMTFVNLFAFWHHKTEYMLNVYYMYVHTCKFTCSIYVCVCVVTWNSFSCLMDFEGDRRLAMEETRNIDLRIFFWKKTERIDF